MSVETLPRPTDHTTAEDISEHLPAYLSRALERQQQAEAVAVRAEVLRRCKLLREVDKSQHRRALARTIARSDCKQFINDWVWTYDPRNVGTGIPTRLPLKLRPKQEELLDWLDALVAGKENGLIEKSRDEGATWVVAAWSVHRWLFQDGVTIGFGSRSLELVDRLGDMDAILPKVRFIIEWLPKWMRPVGWDARFHSNHRRIKNPETMSLIKGDGGKNIGRGGRSTVYFVDEHSHIDKAQEVENALSNNTDTIVYIGTPNGTGNLFYTKRHSGTIPVFTLHWRDNPAKNFEARRRKPDGTYEKYHPWYQLQQIKFDPVVIAQEVDLDYSASMTGVFIPGKWVRAAVAIRLRRGTTRWGALDVGEGRDETVYAERAGSVLSRLIGWISDDTTYSGREAIRLGREGKITFFRFDRVGVGSGVSGVLKNTDDLPFLYEGYNAGAPASYILYRDDPDRTADDRFTNRKAEDYWSLRLRFYRTWQVVEGLATYPAQDLISIPNDPTLIAQLSVTKYFQTDVGLIRAEKKEELARRGVRSPDRAEATVMLFSSWAPPKTPDTAIRAFNDED